MYTSYYARVPDTYPQAISISRRVPRGTRYWHYPALAPGAWFKTSDRDYYIQQYHKILDALDPQDTWDNLHKIAGGTETCPILLGYDGDGFCHRRLVANWFEKELGFVVPELPPPSEWDFRITPKPPYLHPPKDCIQIPLIQLG